MTNMFTELSVADKIEIVQQCRSGHWKFSSFFRVEIETLVKPDEGITRVSISTRKKLEKALGTRLDLDIVLLRCTTLHLAISIA